MYKVKLPIGKSVSVMYKNNSIKLNGQQEFEILPVIKLFPKLFEKIEVEQVEVINEPAPVVDIIEEVEDEMSSLDEIEISDEPDLESMTKLELDEYAATKGIELDRRKSFAKMLKSFKEQI